MVYVGGGGQADTGAGGHPRTLMYGAGVGVS